MTQSESHLTRRTMLGVAGASMLFPFQARSATPPTITGAAFGTTWQILGPSQAGLERIRPDIDTLFDEIDRQMSPWRRDSALSRINTGSAGWHASSADLVGLTDQALRIADVTGGAFDPTVGPIVASWGFGPIAGGQNPDWRGLSTGVRGIRKARDNLTLDLCGIAKGWALDRAADIARSAGLDHLLMEIGGELLAIGQHPSGRSWHVAVEHPVPGQPAAAVLRLPAGMAVATSGLRIQSYTLAGRTIGHIINPAARAPATGALRSVTVLAVDAMTADGWATALFAAGEAVGPALAKAHGIDAVFLVSDRSRLRQIRTGAIKEALL